MKYELITLEEKTILGLNTCTRNLDPKMEEIIGELWKKLFESGVFFTIKNRVNEHSIGLYSDYEADENGTYEVTVGCEVSRVDEKIEGLVEKHIPAGHYAKFVAFGDKVEAVREAWKTIWELPLKRTFSGDFEEYVSMSENGECEVNIYIAVE